MARCDRDPERVPDGLNIDPEIDEFPYNFDLGLEIDNYSVAFRSYRAEGGDLDYYFIYGPSAREVVEKFTRLTGRRGTTVLTQDLEENHRHNDVQPLVVVAFARHPGYFARTVLAKDGSAEDRASEAAEAARILGVGWRQALDLPDGAVENTLGNRLKIVRVLRLLRPRVVILPYWQARHPDHAIAATLGCDACFLSGLAKVEAGTAPHRPFKIVYASLYADVRPSFVVDITPFIEQRGGSVLLNTHVEGAAWDEGAARWTIQTRTGELTSEFVVVALPFEATAKLQSQAVRHREPDCLLRNSIATARKISAPRRSRIYAAGAFKIGSG